MCHMTNTGYDLVCLRMIYNISDQFSELKVILSASSNSSSTSRSIARDSPGDATTSANYSSPDPAFQLIVQDLSAAEIAGQSSLPRVT